MDHFLCDFESHLTPPPSQESGSSSEPDILVPGSAQRACGKMQNGRGLKGSCSCLLNTTGQQWALPCPAVFRGWLSVPHTQALPLEETPTLRLCPFFTNLQ